MGFTIFDKNKLQKTDLFIECPECKCTDIFYDPVHDEVFCIQCGLLLLQNFSLLFCEEYDEE